MDDSELVNPLADWIGAHWPWAGPLASALLFVAVQWVRGWLARRLAPPEVQFIEERVVEAARAVGAPANPVRPQPKPPSNPFGGP